MALHGSASANLSPILFKGNNRALGVNVIIHQDDSASMNDVNLFYSNGTFIQALQDGLLAEKIGTDVTSYPNLYAYFTSFGRNPSTSFTITNPNGTLNISQAFIRGEATGSATLSKWTGSQYFSNITSNSYVNVCTDVVGAVDNAGRLSDNYSSSPSYAWRAEDVHGNLWSIWTTPNAISTGTPGRFGSVIGSNIRKGSTTILITNSDEQQSAPGDMINELVAVNSSGTQRTINGSTGEMIFRGYRVIALSTYTSTDGYDGVLFYGSTSSLPYGYVTFTSSTTYTITRSSTFPSSWVKSGNQIHDTLTIASETRGGLFKINDVFTNSGVDNRVAFSKCLAAFIVDTV